MNDFFPPDDVIVVFARLKREWQSYLGASASIERVANGFFGKPDIYDSYREALESGRTYLGGNDYPMDKYLQQCTDDMPVWLQQAAQFAGQYPEEKLVVISPAKREHWTVFRRGEYTCLSLPHHGWGGEKSWITMDCKHMVLVNQD